MKTLSRSWTLDSDSTRIFTICSKPFQAAKWRAVFPLFNKKKVVKKRRKIKSNITQTQPFTLRTTREREREEREREKERENWVWKKNLLVFELEVDIKFKLFVFVSKKKNFDNFFISILNTFKKFFCFFVWIFFIHLLFFCVWEKRREEKSFFWGSKKSCEKRRENKKVWWIFFEERKKGKRKRKRNWVGTFSLYFEWRVWTKMLDVWWTGKMIKQVCDAKI